MRSLIKFIQSVSIRVSVHTYGLDLHIGDPLEFQRTLQHTMVLSDEDNTTPTGATMTQTITPHTNAALPLKLPTFSTTDPMAWFCRAEIQFRLKKTPEERHADYVLEALPADVFAQISSWLVGQPPEIKYKDIKTLLMRQYSTPSSMRTQQILAKSKISIGSQDPESTWNEFQALARLPADETGTSNSLDMLRELWLLTLPDIVRQSIDDASTMPMEQLLPKVRKRLNAHMARQASPVTAVQKQSDSEQCSLEANSDNDLVNDISAVQQNRKQLKTTQNSQPRVQMCYFHRKFGKEAIKCTPTCVYAKNENAGRR